MYQALVIASFAYEVLCFVSGAVCVSIAWWGYVEVRKELKEVEKQKPEQEVEPDLAYLETDFSHLL